MPVRFTSTPIVRTRRPTFPPDGVRIVGGEGNLPAEPVFEARAFVWSMRSGGSFLSRGWSIVFLAIAASLAAHLVQVFVLPLWPYAAGVAVLMVVGYVVVTWTRRSRW